jgi:hypothetical protein
MKVYTDLGIAQNSFIKFVSREDFPSSPTIGQVAFVENVLYVYTDLGDTPTWFPLSKKNAYFVHEQEEPALEWTVIHGLGTTDLGFFVYNGDGEFQIASIDFVDASSVKIILTEPTSGKAVLFAGVETGVSSPAGDPGPGDPGGAAGNWVDVIAVTADYTMTSDNELVLVDTTLGDVTITLPDATGAAGRIVYIKKHRDESGMNYSVIIQGIGGQAIDNHAQLDYYETYAAFTLVSDGTQWYIV